MTLAGESGARCGMNGSGGGAGGRLATSAASDKSARWKLASADSTVDGPPPGSLCRDHAHGSKGTANPLTGVPG